MRNAGKEIGYYNSDLIGNLEIVLKNKKLVSLHPSEDEDDDEEPEYSDEMEDIINQLEEYFKGERKQFDVEIAFESGTKFQKQVWEALLTIPYGVTKSYKDIARLVGNENACRAVGGAIHNNPIMIIVPCHRVIGANGSLTGFGGGLDMKKKLLDHESKLLL